jgi:hypothetical protein
VCDFFFFLVKIEKREKKLTRKMSRAVAVTKGSTGRVPDKYLSYQKERSDVKTTVLEIRPQTSSP